MRLLLLAGTSDARAVAEGLATRAGLSAIASLAGATRAPGDLPIPSRTGGFGGDDAFADWLRAHGIGAVIDATHPFAHRISSRTARICAALDLPHLHLLRPPWRPGPGDIWHEVADEAAAASLIPPGSTVFLATGRQTLDRFAGLRDCRVICRQIDPPDGPFPFPGGEFLVGRPPFSENDEAALFRRLAVDWLVVKNAGGMASRTKLDAARRLGLPVAVIARPSQPECLTVPDATSALLWVDKLLERAGRS
ncbi:MAG: cobalt-precorrin-6A reductase [Rhodobacteraceae bacterium]|nr:cobalt-precorrin-6A reductase [Paracoccaceae bacterium]